MEHQKCYIYEPPKAKGSKKRKREDSGDTAWQCRKRVFERLWTRQSARVEAVLTSANEETLNKVGEFISRAKECDSTKIPAGLVTAGPNIASHSALFQQLSGSLKEQGSNAYVVLSAKDCPNLKSLLKVLIAKATARNEASDGDQVTTARVGHGPKPLNYDIQLLQDHMESHGLERVIVVFQDTEAFDSHVLSDAVDLLHLWRTRIPFVLLFGVATSTDAFQDRLSRTALRSLQGQKFDVVQADELLERVFSATIEGDEPRLWLGPEVTSMIFERQKDNLQSASDFFDTLKYAYMSHCFANQVSLWTDPQEDLEVVDKASKDDYETLRMLPSLQQEVTDMLDAGGEGVAPKVKGLLESDGDLRLFAQNKVNDAHERIRMLVTAIRVIHKILSRTSKSNTPPLSALYARAMGGKLTNSPLLREMLLFLKRADSIALQCILEALLKENHEHLDFASSTHTALQSLVGLAESEGPLRSEHDDRHTTVRTTIIAKKAQLSKEKSSLSKNDESYSSLLAKFVASLEDYLRKALIDPKDLCFYEAFIYDIKGPLRASFAPRTRAAVERALSAPHDYLACDCCAKSDESTLSASQPATAILYQLYLESGSLINVSDLYSAFIAIMGDEVGDEDRIKALFQRGLAELKYLGMVRPSRKKTDHIAKAAWKGF